MRLKNVIATLLVMMLSAAIAASPASGQFSSDDALAGTGSDVPADLLAEAAAPSLEGFERLDGPVIVEASDPSIDVESPEVQATVAEIQQLNEAAEKERLEGLGEQVQVPPGKAASGGGLSASFDTAVPSNVRTVVNAAIADWDAALETPVPVVVQVFWQCFNSPGLLGFAGPSDIYVEGGLIYPAALAHNLGGSDLNGATAEIEITLNAELTSNNTCVFEFDDWYISTNANPTNSQIDLYSVVLHEIGHGLGFLGSAQDPDGSGFAQAQLSFPRFVYDTFVYAGSGPLLSSASPNSQLTSNNLFFDIGGERLHRVYAPSTFQNGSSFSHFDTIYFGGDPGELMTPALGPGEVRRSLDGPVLGLLAQQGWGVVPRAITPSISLSTSPGKIDVSWQANLGSYGTPPLTYTVQAFANGTLAAQKTVNGGEDDTVLNQLTNGLDYTIEVTPNDVKGAAVTASAEIRLPAYPNPPKYVRSDGVGLVRAVTWGSPDPSGGGPETYTVQARQVGENWTTIGTTANNSITTPTLAEQPYQFRVRATNADGNGEYSYSTIIGASETIVRPFPLDGQVARLYSAYFLRAPDQAGFDYWLGQRASGVGLSSISAAFAKSPEFIDRYGSMSNAQFVDQVYQNVTGRTPDTEGREFWIAFLDAGNSRGAMMIGFSESAEYQTSTGTVGPTTSSEGSIYRLYLAFFLREPDVDGLSFWTGELDGGRTFGSIADGFVGSPEFQTEYGSLSNDHFVELVYANVLIRPPDAAGYDFWLGELESGSATRGQMMAQFAESLEFIVRSGSLP